MLPGRAVGAVVAAAVLVTVPVLGPVLVAVDVAALVAFVGLVAVRGIPGVVARLLARLLGWRGEFGTALAAARPGGGRATGLTLPGVARHVRAVRVPR